MNNILIIQNIEKKKTSFKKSYINAKDRRKNIYTKHRQF